MADSAAILEQRRAAWDRKPFLRAVYGDFYRRIRSRLWDGDAPILELGCGAGGLKSAIAGVIASDVIPNPWADAVLDALALPFREGAFSNIVMVDVFHHLALPFAFLDEARRVLRPGGRILMVEPYASPLSRPLYRRFHPEPFDFSQDPFRAEASRRDEPFESNQALPQMLFFRDLERFQRRTEGRWKLVERERFAFLAYPLSGGFREGRGPPGWTHPVVSLAERAARPIARLAAFRCFVVLERARRSPAP